MNLASILSLTWAVVVIGSLFLDERGPAYWFALAATVFFTGVALIISEIRKAAKR